MPLKHYMLVGDPVFSTCWFASVLGVLMPQYAYRVTQAIIKVQRYEVHKITPRFIWVKDHGQVMRYDRSRSLWYFKKDEAVAANKDLLVMQIEKLAKELDKFQLALETCENIRNIPAITPLKPGQKLVLE